MIISNVGDNREQLGHLCIAGGSVIGTRTLDNSWAVSTKVKQTPVCAYPVT